MINRPPFFETFAASIRHQDTGEGSSVTYRFTFSTRPRLLRWLLEPITLVAPPSKRRRAALQPAAHLTHFRRDGELSRAGKWAAFAPVLPV